MGEIAALAVSLCWSLASIQFTLAGQRTGSGVVNRTRLVLAVLYLCWYRLDADGVEPDHCDPPGPFGFPRPDQPALCRWYSCRPRGRSRG